MENNTSDIYKNRKWVNARQPADVDRTDWHRNSQGLVDYLPVDANCHKTGNETPLEKQKYDVEHEMKRERGASSLAAIRESKPDWDEYERIINEFN